MIQVVVTSTEGGNIQFYQDGRALGVLDLAEATELIAVLRTGGAEVTDLRPAEAAVNGASLVI